MMEAANLIRVPKIKPIQAATPTWAERKTAAGGQFAHQRAEEGPEYQSGNTEEQTDERADERARDCLGARADPLRTQGDRGQVQNHADGGDDTDTTSQPDPTC